MKIYLTNPYTNETDTLTNWAIVLKTPRISMYARWRRNPNSHAYVLFGSNYRVIAKLLYGDDAAKVKLLIQPKPFVNHEFVFRPDTVINGSTVSHAAYLPNDLETPVVDNIVEWGEGYAWNCYSGFEGSTKSEVANRVYHLLHVEKNYDALTQE